MLIHDIIIIVLALKPQRVIALLTRRVIKSNFWLQGLATNLFDHLVAI